jgi:small ligand-binding sensory domain FIST
VLDEVEELFVRQRRELEADLRNDQASTEDLRLALGRYRTFFDRLLRI